MAWIVLYIATSNDGFIADPDGGVDWLPHPDEGTDNVGFDSFLDSIDVIAQRRTTFLQSLSFIEQGIVSELPYKGKHMYVFTHIPLSTKRTDVTFVSSINEFLSLLSNNEQIKRVWLLGGAELIESFAQKDLIDEAIITTMPVTIHNGIPLPSLIYKQLTEVDTRNLPMKMIEKHYIRRQ